jgi:nucleoside-diphosphate-sugar epimerase
MRGKESARTLITGASGFVGGLVAAALLDTQPRELLLPLRPGACRSACISRIRNGLSDRGVREYEINKLIPLVRILELPPNDRLPELTQFLGESGVNEIIHCAGSVDYFDKPLLDTANIELTSRLVNLGLELNIDRIIYLSTAFCSGYSQNIIPEQLHGDPGDRAEPNEYTRSKRIAEWCVAESGLPFIIIRPSVIIGDSKTGRYSGKNYGLYQMWRALEGLFSKGDILVWHIAAPRVGVNFVHQDAFQAAFNAIYTQAQSGSVIHLTSDPLKEPSVLDLNLLWADVYRPPEVHCYSTLDEIPLDLIPKRQRRFLQVTAKNNEIATHGWKFETKGMDLLRQNGLMFSDTTVDSVKLCQRRYLESSPRLAGCIRRADEGIRGQSRIVEIIRSI